MPIIEESIICLVLILNLSDRFHADANSIQIRLDKINEDELAGLGFY